MGITDFIMENSGNETSETCGTATQSPEEKFPENSKVCALNYILSYEVKYHI